MPDIVAPQEPRPPRTIVTTDPELDDLNSMLRMLLYSNELDIRGLVYSSSQFHYAGNPDLGISPHRWPAEGERLHIDQAVDAYAAAYPNLVRHDGRYPSPERLRGLVAWGNVENVGDMREDTPGSDLIRAALLDDEPGQIFLQVWGGPNTIARALRSIEEDYRHTPEWETIRASIEAKAVITSFGQQDDTFTDYIKPTWPGIENREVATTVWGYFARHVADPEDLHLLEPDWTRDNISNVGPMGAAYRVWGDGRQMAAGFDREDYFGLAGHSADELKNLGYWVWMPPQPAGGFISEGDSSNFALLVANGLRSWEHPSWGGWGGRQAVDSDDPRSSSNKGVRDEGPDGRPRDDWAAARWLRMIQHDFAGRLRWTVTADFGAANHHPSVVIEEGVDLRRPAGSTVRLTARASDPDGDSLTYRWWQYREAGTSSAELDLEPNGDTVSFALPADAVAGETVHVILEVTDSGSPPLTACKRVVVEIADIS
ncbi:DUF1593 domain-containing protein [Tessaracoccus lapidicaptus]|uniref:DUF1593 domain-containing protein n=1 Tax=Tessaracoccus lapidicaptus TaxID=1427523 RepID=UPI003342B400